MRRILMLSLASLLLLAGCGKDTPPNIVVVVLDTVRADAAGLAGGATPDPLRSADLTPSLSALAAEGVSFRDCTSAAPWTVPSHASIFTGKLPSGHVCVSRRAQLTEDQPTFAAQLAQAGYATAAFYSNPWLADRTTHLLRGFEERVESEIGKFTWDHGADGDQGSRGSLDAARAWLARRADDGRPFLLFMNILEAHLTYDPHGEYRRAHLQDLPPDDVVSIAWSHDYMAELVDPAGVDWNHVARLYAGDVWTADRHLGELLQALREQGLDDDTVIIVTSDHGEQLGEHGLVEHQFSLYEPLLHVPLVVRVPPALRGRFDAGAPAGGERIDPVQTTDLYATVLDLAGVRPAEAPRFSRSLFAGPNPADRPVYAEYSGPAPGLLKMLQGKNPAADLKRHDRAIGSVRVGDLRLIVDNRGGAELYDLGDDPGQLHDIAAQQPEAGRALLDLLRRASEPAPDDLQPVELDARTRQQLESLGYIH
ncbi:MAG TPA: sulfatase [Candidatus Krumholzibacteria bacterium]|nr:sulfatase [Candidatus Krumholzibacteria bacterium]